MKCFDYHKHKNIKCEKINCRYWIDCKESQMCCINLCNTDKSFTLEDVGKIFGVTRMRVCQIEKTIIGKIKKRAYEALSLE